MPIINPEEVWQKIEKEGLFPEDLNLDPAFVRKVFLSNKMIRTLSLLSGLTAQGQKPIKATTGGELKVASTSSGLEQYVQETGSAADTFAAADTYTYAESHSRWDIMVENNDAVVQFRNPTDTAWLDNMILNTGLYSIDITSLGIRLQNRVAGSVADYQVISYY